MKQIMVMLLGAATVLSSPRASSPHTLQLEAQGWGETVSGLRVGISAKLPIQPQRGAQFEISFHNASEFDYVLNLGHTLAAARVISPSLVRLRLIDAHDKTRNLQFFDRHRIDLNGRVDPFMVALRHGATYVLPITLDDFWNEANQLVRVVLAPGRHRVMARFEGHGPRHVNLDTQGLTLMNFWKGQVDSGVLEFDVR